MLNACLLEVLPHCATQTSDRIKATFNSGKKNPRRKEKERPSFQRNNPKHRADTSRPLPLKKVQAYTSYHTCEQA